MELAIEEGKEPPSLYEGYPEGLEDYLFWYLEAFFSLSSSRGTTMEGPWYIPVSEMMALSRIYRLTQEETERFIAYMQALDEVYMDVMMESRTDSRKSPNGTSPSSNSRFINR